MSNGTKFMQFEFKFTVPPHQRSVRYCTSIKFQVLGSGEYLYGSHGYCMFGARMVKIRQVKICMKVRPSKLTHFDLLCSPTLKTLMQQNRLIRFKFALPPLFFSGQYTAAKPTETCLTCS